MSLKLVRKSVLLRPAAVLAILFLVASAQAGETYLKPDAIDVAAVLSGPPADDSAEHKAEVQTLLDWQAKRTPEQVARCKAEEAVTPFVFSEVLGGWFKPEDLPLTAALLRETFEEAKIYSDIGKKKWNRTRPPLADPRIEPCVELEHSGSYPSGHATRGVLWATVLAEMFPEYKDKLMARGKLIGEDRVIAGMHYPSDVAAGQRLGAEIAKQLLANPQFHAAMEKAKDECLADTHAHDPK